MNFNVLILVYYYSSLGDDLQKKLTSTRVNKCVGFLYKVLSIFYVYKILL
jgi:hypothetical protein